MITVHQLGKNRLAFHSVCKSWFLLAILHLQVEIKSAKTHHTQIEERRVGTTEDLGVIAPLKDYHSFFQIHKYVIPTDQSILKKGFLHIQDGSKYSCRVGVFHL